MRQIKVFKQSLIGCLLGGFLGMTWMTSDAAAQTGISEGCHTLVDNTTWNDGILVLHKAIESKDYEAGLKVAATLTNICAESPILNYYVGLAMQGQGDNVKSLIYFQKASQFISEFTVTPEVSRRIWYSRYEGEYPERTEDSVNRRTEENKRLASDNADLSKRLTEAERTIETLTHSNNTLSEQLLADAKTRYATTMWTGVGIGIAGILVSVGGGLLVKFSNNIDSNEITPQYISGWAMFGGGIGLTIAGAVVAGIGGWQYTHVGSKDTVSDDISVSLHFNGTGATFGMTF